MSGKTILHGDRGNTDPACWMARHALATLAYRASKAVRNAPADFGIFRIGSTTRTPNEILAHMGDLMEWALTMAQDRTQWRERPVWLGPAMWIAYFRQSLVSMNTWQARQQWIHSSSSNFSRDQ
jgi:hypothetical protein